MLPLREHGWDVFADNDGNLHVYSYGGGTTGGRTGEDGRGENGTKVYYYLRHNDKGKIEFVYQLTVETSHGDLVIPIEFNDPSIDSREQFMITMELCHAFNVILAADPTYFDALFGGNYNISIESGFNIAANSNSIVEGNFMVGLHSPDKSNDNKATIRISTELFRGDKVYDPTTNQTFDFSYKAKYSNIFGILYEHDDIKWSVWEVVAHEFGHHKDFLKFGRNDFFKMDYNERENLTISQVNILRAYYGMRQERYKTR